MSDSDDPYEYPEGDEIPSSLRKVRIEESVESVRVMECAGCGHDWQPRVDRPKRCPKCNAEINYERSNLVDALVNEETDGDEEPEMVTVDDLFRDGDSDE